MLYFAPSWVNKRIPVKKFPDLMSYDAEIGDIFVRGFCIRFFFTGYLKNIISIGLAQQNGDTWRQLRKLTVTALRDFGVGKAAIESKLHIETSDMVAYIDQKKNTYFSPVHLFDLAVSNSINIVLFDKR